MPRGGAAERSTRRAEADTPIWAHSSHAKSTRRSRAVRLRSEICIVNSEVVKGSFEHLAESGRRIMGPCPPCCLDELLPGGPERAKIPLVLAEPLIHERVELEMDLVQPRREVDRQTRHPSPTC